MVLGSMKDSLEKVVACERVQSLARRTESLVHMRASLREERRRLRLAAEDVDRRRAMIQKLKREDWFDPHCFPSPLERVKLSVGDMVYLYFLFLYNSQF